MAVSDQGGYVFTYMLDQRTNTLDQQRGSIL